jgi:predicted SAM-dependent methyltransferase
MKLHIGCGKHYKKGWVNCDIQKGPNKKIDKLFDATKEFPYNDDSVDFIYSEHVLEHFQLQGAEVFLRECKRVLKDTGVLRLSIPNLDMVVDNYIAMNTTPINSCPYINKSFHGWGHKFLYNHQFLVTKLVKAGFKVIQTREWGKSPIAVLRGLETRKYNRELIVEATYHEVL